MNPAGNTSGKSWNNNLRLPLNRQGMVADLRVSKPSPPRVAEVAPQPGQCPNGHFFAMHPAMPGGHGAGDGQTPPRQEDPLHALSREPMAQTLNTGVHARFSYMPPPPSSLWHIDAAVQPTGPAQGHPPVGESSGPGWTTPGQMGAPSFGEARKAPFGDENVDLPDSTVNRLFSDDYEAYDLEASNIRALMADYEATFPDTGAAPPISPAQGHPPVGESPGPGWTAGQVGASPFDGDLEALLDQTIMACGDESADLFNSVMNRLFSDDYEAYDLEESDIRALMADYETTFSDAAPPPGPAQEHSPLGKSLGPARPPGQMGAPPLGGALEAPSAVASGGERAEQPAVPLVDSGDALKRARGDYMPVTGDQRQAILHVFKTDIKRSSQSIAGEIGVSGSTIRRLRKRFSKTGDIKPGIPSKCLSGDQRRAIMHIFETDPERSNQSIADEFNASYSTIAVSRKQFGKTGDLRPGDHAKRLNGDQRRAILQIFKTDRKRSYESIADEIGVSFSTIKRLKRQFGKTGNIESRDIINRLTDDQRQAIMQIFKADPGRSNQSIADDFGVVEKTIRVLKRRFENTGNIKVRDHKKRLNGDQRRAIMQIFETDPKRSIQSIADDFGVSTFSINILKRKFKKTGTIKEGDHGNRLTDDQRQAILHIFGTDPERSNQSIAEEFGVAYSTILKLRKKFRKQAI